MERRRTVRTPNRLVSARAVPARWRHPPRRRRSWRARRAGEKAVYGVSCAVVRRTHHQDQPVSGGGVSLRSLPTIGLDFDALAHRLAGPSGCRIYTPDPSTRALLESFWDIDDREPLTRLRLKTLELIALANATPHLAPRSEDYQRRSTIESLERGMGLLGSNLEQNVTVADAAKASCMGMSAFKEKFTKAFGVTPMAYRRQCRMTHAAQLLGATDKSVSDIALSVGYRNPSKFSAAFAATFGHSPSGYRAANRAGGTRSAIAFQSHEQRPEAQTSSNARIQVCTSKTRQHASLDPS